MVVVLRLRLRQEVAVVVAVVAVVVVVVVLLGKPLLDLDCNLLGKDLDKHLELHTKFRYRRFHKSLRS